MVSKREVVPQDESALDSCLHCEINDLVQEYVEGHETVDIAEVAARIAESLVDLVLRAPEGQQAQLLAATISYLGQAFLKREGRLRVTRTRCNDGPASFPRRGREKKAGRAPHQASSVPVLLILCSCHASCRAAHNPRAAGRCCWQVEESSAQGDRGGLTQASDFQSGIKERASRAGKRQLSLLASVRSLRNQGTFLPLRGSIARDGVWSLTHDRFG